MSEIEKLYTVIKERKNNPQEKSYTTYLFDKGKEKILKKVGEESSEVLIAAMKNSKDELIMELCDLTYHLLVLMAHENIDIESIKQELESRARITGNLKAERKEINDL